MKDPRREQERIYSRMVQEDHTAMANLSPVPIHREWNRNIANPSPVWDNVVYKSFEDNAITGERYAKKKTR